MSTAVWAFIGVVVGGLLTVAAQATAESLKARAAARARQEQRARASREFQRDTLIELQAAMADYRAAHVSREFGGYLLEAARDHGVADRLQTS